MHSDYDFYDPGSGLHNSQRCESGGPQIAGQTGEIMEIRQLEYFRAIVDAGTISGAARELHMTQPPLSYQMKMLEEELQVPLFIRESVLQRSVSLFQLSDDPVESRKCLLDIHLFSCLVIHMIPHCGSISCRIVLFSYLNYCLIIRENWCDR